MRRSKEFHVLKIGSLLLAGFSFFYFFYKTVIGGAGIVDVKEYWRYMAYSIRGYDISTCAANGIVLENIGAIGGGIVLPWGRLLGNLIYPGFLSLTGATVYYYLLLIVCTGVAGYYILKWIEKVQVDDWQKKENVIFTVCLMIMPLYWDDALNTGNMGGIFCVFLILAAIFLERSPCLASFFIAMAMIKPQNAALFMLVLLLKKKFKMICQVLGIMTASVGLSEVYERVCSYFRGGIKNASFWDKVMSMLRRYSGNGQGTKQEGVLPFFTYGILDKLIDYGVSSYIVLIGSALLGIIFVFGVLFYIRDYKGLNGDWIVLFSIAALGSIFWCYKTPCDEIIIILCNLLSILYWKYGGKDLKSVLEILIYLICINMKVFRFWGRKILPIELDTAVVADQILRIIVYVGMIVRIKQGMRKYNEQIRR